MIEEVNKEKKDIFEADVIEKNIEFSTKSFQIEHYYPFNLFHKLRRKGKFLVASSFIFINLGKVVS